MVPQINTAAPSATAGATGTDTRASCLEAWHAASGHGGDRRVEWDALARVSQQSAYASAVADDEVLAVGRAVVDDGWAGVLMHGHLPAAPWTGRDAAS